MGVVHDQGDGHTGMACADEFKQFADVLRVDMSTLKISETHTAHKESRIREALNK